MIRIQQLKLPISHTEEQLVRKVERMLKVRPTEILQVKISRQSIDARKKEEISYVYTVDVLVKNEPAILKRIKNRQVFLLKEINYQFPKSGTLPLCHAPVIVGSGPAGLFCGYHLAKHGYAPIILERGKPIEERVKDVENFWNQNELCLESNVQFGEGGAGTFSDGKLNTLVKDVKGRNREVLNIFISHGAPQSIGYQSKPHIGTDYLRTIIPNMRRQIEAWGGTYLFETCAIGLDFQGEHLAAVTCKNPRGTFSIETDVAVLAIGHSARDTFEMLHKAELPMEAKSFAVGLRVEHPQSMVDKNQYGNAAARLPAASYKLTANLENSHLYGGERVTANKRGVYSFCMCPGGYVVNASSEENRIAVNGMSYSGRNGQNANSAIIVTVTPEDFGTSGPLSGVQFQRRLEEKAFLIGNGAVPQQLFGDFEQQKVSQSYGSFSSSIKGHHHFGALHQLFPEEIYTSFCAGMHKFTAYIPDFDRPDTILSGVESRTSSPVRIIRDESFQSSKRGIYPCGEGAGYAGGIMSAAMDGMKVAEAIAGKYEKTGGK